jgi:uncharacterized protein YdiU (UPF0061 family)
MIVCRVAPSFTRFGHFEIHAARGDLALLQQLLDYTIRTDFPQLGAPSPETYLLWFEQVCERTLAMIVHWMRVGFVHGVMNTDNMSILGLTIDYGPYGWLESFDLNWTPNTTDAGGRRYAFGRQPQVALWNLLQLANAIHPLVQRAEPLEAALVRFADGYEPAWQQMCATRLGLAAHAGADDSRLIADLQLLLASVETDFVIFHRKLAQVDLTALSPQPDAPPPDELLQAYYSPDSLSAQYRCDLQSWLRRYAARVQADGSNAAERRSRMDAINPKYVLRNYQAQLAIDAAEKGDMTVLEQLHDVLRRPYDEQPGHVALSAKRPEWARDRAGCSMLSCSS